ncbi:MAG TPA: glycosyl hydrolase, partial [Verrucomicrobiae bacterium]|nr:glycosyl hydrolase [Verrucomicrobiae bacterium]
MRTKLLIALALSLYSRPLVAADLSAQFAQPPASARPWVYWFWNNGNVTKAGITADLEAMKRAGIGGVIIMDVVERFAPPPGTADFMNAEWQELFCFAVSEAHRLGLEINMTNGPGWCGSSGPWITPELSMQMLVSTNLAFEGPTNLSLVLPKPETAGARGHDGFNSTVKYVDFYRDIALLAIPQTADGVVAPDVVMNLTAKLDGDGKLNWEVPAGKWIIQRIGHTTTGSSTRPPVKGGNGLECDKLSAEAMGVHFTNMIGKLISQVGPLAGPTFSATHIDSWEVGSQNWTPKFREEFQKRRGYDPIPFLPDVIGGKIHIGDAATASRFRWDFQQTISELLAENYVGRLEELAHEHGLRLTLEGYDLPFGDEAAYTERADEPMTEFWATGGSQNLTKGRQMASVAHIMGKNIVGAEAFTSGDNEQWKFHPATIKALGDYEFSQGINRFVIHRYAHQPYLDRFPGVTMGPWGLHYERTQTWWEMSGAWHEYLSRCQYMLRQGMFVADLCCLRPELPDQTYFTPVPEVPAGYKYDECSAEALIARMSVKDGRLVLPDGMSYRLLMLPEGDTLMTPALVEKIKQLVEAGVTVLGPRPTASPSLSDFPKCDEEVAKLAAEVWGDCDGKTVTEHDFGKGKVIWGQPLKTVLEQMQAPVDFKSSVKLNWIHRQVGDTQVYFVANENAVSVEAKCNFRVKGLRPELWNPQTGEISPLAIYEETAAGISIPLRLEASGSTFVVFRPQAKPFDSVVSFTRDGQAVVPLSKLPAIKIQSATYGVPGDTSRTRDVLSKVQALVDRGELEFQVSQLADGDDPAYGTVKNLVLKYTADGQPFTASGQDRESINLGSSIILTTGAGRGQGLTGEYFTNTDLSGNPTMVRMDPGVNFAWDSASPAAGIPAENWSARWTGILTALKSGEYTFCLYADDGCRLFIDDKNVIDHWSLDSGKEAHTGKINLVAGQRYKFRVEYFQAGGDDEIHLSWLVPAASRAAEIRCNAAGQLEIVASQPGRYELTSASGKTMRAEIKSVPAPQEIAGAWDVRFPPKRGAPKKITLDHLGSLSDSTIAGVKYFSGTATYIKTFDWKPAAEIRNQKTEAWLDLGEVQVMAQVKLNGHDLGILWKPPFRMNVAGALKSGRNTLEIRVANLWPNRMIGDAALPVAERFTWSTYEPFTKDSPLPKSGLMGPVIIYTADVVPTGVLTDHSTLVNFNTNGLQVTRFDSVAAAIDAHDGEIAYFDGVFYLYGTSYDCGYEWGNKDAPFCGFKVYSSKDLVNWTDKGFLFDAKTPVWQSRCNGSTYGCYRPHVVYNQKNNLYVLWINSYDNRSGFHVFTSPSPVGPFTEMAEPTLVDSTNASVGGLNNGDHDLLVDDDGIAYLAFTDWRAGGAIMVEKLNADYTSGTGACSKVTKGST